MSRRERWRRRGGMAHIFQREEVDMVSLCERHIFLRDDTYLYERCGDDVRLCKICAREASR